MDLLSLFPIIIIIMGYILILLLLLQVVPFIAGVCFLFRVKIQLDGSISNLIWNSIFVFVGRGEDGQIGIGDTRYDFPLYSLSWIGFFEEVPSTVWVSLFIFKK